MAATVVLWLVVAVFRSEVERVWGCCGPVSDGEVVRNMPAGVSGSGFGLMLEVLCSLHLQLLIDSLLGVR